MTEGAFEARKIRYAQTKEGHTITFAIHPNDFDRALDMVKASVGTIFAIGFREMPEGDQSAAPSADAGHGSDPVQELPAIAPSEAVADGAPKQRRHFSELPRSTQAALLCGNPVFQKWSSTVDEEDAARFVRMNCGVTTRADLDSYADTSSAWDALHARYRAETGQEAEQRR